MLMGNKGIMVTTFRLMVLLSDWNSEAWEGEFRETEKQKQLLYPRERYMFSMFSLISTCAHTRCHSTVSSFALAHTLYSSFLGIVVKFISTFSFLAVEHIIKLDIVLHGHKASLLFLHFGHRLLS